MEHSDFVLEHVTVKTFEKKQIKKLSVESNISGIVLQNKEPNSFTTVKTLHLQIKSNYLNIFE